MSEERLTQSYGNKMPPEQRPLTNKEILFAQKYVEGNSGAKSVRLAGYNCKAASAQANFLLKKPNVARYIRSLRKAGENSSIASAQEVMEYLTRVMRGEILEINNKPVSIAERSRAAIELAKRTVDLDKDQQADNTVRVVLDWVRRKKEQDSKEEER